MAPLRRLYENVTKVFSVGIVVNASHWHAGSHADTLARAPLDRNKQHTGKIRVRLGYVTDY